MGGAERTARKQRQQKVAGRPVAQARNASADRRKVAVVIIAVVVVAAAILGGVFWTISDRDKTEGQTIQPGQSSSLAADVVQKRDGAVVSVGKPGAAKTIDVYADFLCPYCKMLEDKYGAQIKQAINSGQLTVRYHMVTLLNNSSNPPGYSLDSANAALAAADAHKFVAFHDALYANQPEEGKRGYDKAQLIKLGQDLGITDPGFAQAVDAGTYNTQVQAAFDQAKTDPKLAQDLGGGDFQFATPTVAVGGKAISASGDWLTKVLNGTAG